MDEIEKIKNNPEKIKTMMRKQYTQGLEHVTPQRIERRNLHKKLFQKPLKQWSVVSRNLWRYMKLWMAITTLDWIQVFFKPKTSNVSQEVTFNTNKVAKADHAEMWMDKIDWNTFWNVGLYWLACNAYIGWDMIDKHPVVTSINPLDIIPDPQYQEAEDMRFIGFEQRCDIYSLTEDDWYFWIKEIIERKGQVLPEHDTTRSSILSAGNYPVAISDDWMIDIYHHYITYEGKKYLTSWVGAREILVKIIEIEAKTSSEKKDNRKVTFPVQFYRSNPVSWQFFWANYWDEAGQYADAETILDNLELILARKIAMGDDRFINTSIVDIKTFQTKTPWGRMIPVKLGQWEDIRQSIFTVPQDTPWQLPQYVSQKLKQRQEETTAMGNLAYGISPDWNQTKGEISILQQNMNTLFSYSITMLMRGHRRFWKLWHSYYVYNLNPKSKKFISISKWGGVSNVFEFTKKEFAPDVPMEVEIQSIQQEKQEKKEKFARFQIIMGTILPNTKPWSYAFNEIMREYLTLWELEKDEIMKFVPYTIGEIKAMEWLVLLEWGEKPASPQDWQDYDVFINYYSFAPDSDEKFEIMQEYIDAKKVQDQMEKQASLMAWIPQQQWGKVDSIAQGQVWNMLAQESSWQMPSLQTIG